MAYKTAHVHPESEVTSLTSDLAALAAAVATKATIVDSRALVSQVADISTTNFSNVSANGMYRVNWYLVPSAINALAGAVILTFGWTDSAAAQTHAETPVVLTATGESQGVETIFRASGNISFAISHTGIFSTAAYDLYLRLEYLG